MRQLISCLVVFACLLLTPHPAATADGEVRPDLVNGFCIAAMTSSAEQLDELAARLGGVRRPDQRRWLGPGHHRADFDFPGGAAVTFYWNDRYTSLNCYINLPGVSPHEIRTNELSATRAWDGRQGLGAWSKSDLCHYGAAGLLRLSEHSDRGICLDMSVDIRGPQPITFIYLGYQWGPSAVLPPAPARPDRAAAEVVLNSTVFDYCMPTVSGTQPRSAIDEQSGWVSFPSPYTPPEPDPPARWAHGATAIDMSSSFGGSVCTVRGLFSRADGTADRLRAKLASLSVSPPEDSVSSENVRTVFYELAAPAPNSVLALFVREYGLPDDGMIEVTIFSGEIGTDDDGS